MTAKRRISNFGNLTGKQKLPAVWNVDTANVFYSCVDCRLPEEPRSKRSRVSAVAGAVKATFTSLSAVQVAFRARSGRTGEW
jgi:predicted carbohydrate-binding protein with CBM5 and CBM33 domain